MKIHELRERSAAELATLETELGQQLWKARFDNHAQRLGDSDKIRRIRRHRARVLTLLKERELQR